MSASSLPVKFCKRSWDSGILMMVVFEYAVDGIRRKSTNVLTHPQSIPAEMLYTHPCQVHLMRKPQRN